jgi:hypothetical protein
VVTVRAGDREPDPVPRLEAVGDREETEGEFYDLVCRSGSPGSAD